MFSDFVESWGSDVRFFAHPTNGGPMFRLQKNTEDSTRLMLSPPGRKPILSLEWNQIDNAVLCYPHDNIDGRYSRDECRVSNLA